MIESWKISRESYESPLDPVSNVQQAAADEEDSREKEIISECTEIIHNASEKSKPV